MDDDKGITSTRFSELRKRAQKYLSASPSDAEALSQENVIRLVHELDTYQVELELQNEDLIKAQTELEHSRRRFSDLYDFAPVGYITVSDKGLIVEANLTAATLLGVVRGTLVTQPISRFIHGEDQDTYYLHLKRLYSAYATYPDQAHGPLSFELRMKNEHKNTPSWVNMVTTLVHQPDGTVASRITLNDITDRKLLDSYKEMGKKILRVLNAPSDTKELIRQVIAILQNDAGFDAVGIRLQEGEDFPYFDQAGFTPDFLQTENSLVERTLDGGLCRDKDGRVSLECTCGLVIFGRTDPASPQFTPGGSSWTNNSFDFLETPRDKDPRQNPRNLCIHQGYASVALVPIRDKDIIIGLIQLNDRQKGRFTQEIVEEMESLASQIGVTLMRKRAEEALEKSERKYRFFTENIDDIIWTMNAELTHYTYMSSSISRLGYTPEEFTSKPFDAFIVPKYREHLKRAITERLQKEQQGKGDDDVRRWELGYLKKSGKAVYVESITRPLRDKNGLFQGLLGVSRDITEKIQYEKALQKAHDELEQRVLERTIELQKTQKELLHAEKLSAIGGLSASIAHEFNNPLQGVMNVIKGIKRRATMDEEDAQLVESAISECTRMKNLINNLQDFNRPTSGRIAPMDIHAAIDSLLMLSKKEYQTKGITVETSYADLPQIKAVADQIKQVLLNLLNNAADACSRGDTITISTDVIGNERIQIKIQDTGKGVKPEHIDKIFDPFFTTKPPIKGTGLGLSISYGIIKKHGGRIDVASEPGKDTIFTITLPLAGVTDEK